MYKKIILKISILLFISAISVVTHGAALFVDNTLTITGAVGYTQFEEPVDQTLKISNYVSDLLLTHSKQHHIASTNFSAKQQVMVHCNKINKLTLGPALYFQKIHYSGDVWELALPEFFNYQYHLKSNNINFLLESDLYFNPIAHILPFLTAGLGFGLIGASYDDFALPGIPMDSELHGAKSSTKAVYELGAGLALPINPHWTINLRYAYFYMGKVNIPITQFQPLSINLNNQNVFLGINYSL